MKEKLIKAVKYNPAIFKLVNSIGSLFFYLVRYLVPIRKNQILFVSYGGKQFSDSPKVIFEWMKDNDKFKKNIFVWGVTDKALVPYKQENLKVVKIDSFAYFFYVLTSKYWITNSSVERSFNLKKRNQIYINTWHGTPLKKMGIDIPISNESFRINKPMKVDIFLSQSNYETDIFSRVFQIDKGCFRQYGLPRNDRLYTPSVDEITDIKNKIGLNDSRTIILYAPTFREYNIKKGKYSFNDELAWLSKLDSNYIVLLRGHYEIANIFNENFEGINNVVDMSNYSDLNDLILISDILVTDYSSIMFDYLATSKTIVLYQFDFDEYSEKRGMYFDVRKYLRYTSTPAELVHYLNKNLYKHDSDRSKDLIRELDLKYGNSTKKIVEEVFI